VNAAIQEKTAENPFKTAGNLVEEVITSYVRLEAPCVGLPKLDNLKRTANRRRAKNRPKHPEELDFQIQDDFIPEHFLLSDINTDGHRHLIFSTEAHMALLSKAKTWYIDGTFKVVHPSINCYRFTHLSKVVKVKSNKFHYFLC
jgi:hypothetical protein